MFTNDFVVLRARKGVPGVGRKLAKHFNANEVTCGFKPKIKVPDGALVINYGRSALPVWYEEAFTRGVRLVNTPAAVGNCVNKILTLKLLTTNNVPCLEFTSDKNVVWGWLEEGYDAIARQTVTGKQGSGIEFITVEEHHNDIPFCAAPLYTKHYDKTHEFRVHVVDGKVIDLVQKKRMGKKKRALYALEAADELIRNHKRGWVFAHNDLICDTHKGNSREFLNSLAVSACAVLGLDYGGVDILAKYDDEGKFIDAVVCEVNSAPGMSSPTTFKAYVKAFKEMKENNDDA